MDLRKDFAESRGTTILNIDPRKLKVKPGLNSRDMDAQENRDHVEWLAQSITEVGVQTPLVIFSEKNPETGDDEVYIASGHSRLAGTMLAIEHGADIHTIPCMVEAKGTNDLGRILLQHIDNSGKPLTALEIGRNIKRMLGMGLSEQDIAGKLSKSISYVHQMLELQAAPEEVHQMIRQGQVSPSLANAVVREEGANGAEVLKKAVIKAGKRGKKKATVKDLPQRPGRPAGSKNKVSKTGQVADSLVKLLKGISQSMETALDDARTNDQPIPVPMVEKWHKGLSAAI